MKGNFKTIVMLPKYVDVMEWVAVNSEFGYIVVNAQGADCCDCSLRLLPEPQPVLRCDLRVLHRAELSHHGSRAKVRPLISFVLDVS